MEILKQEGKELILTLDLTLPHKENKKLLRRCQKMIDLHIRELDRLITFEAQKNAKQLDLINIIEEVEKEIKPLYGVGDKVKIVNYGHKIWQSKKEPVQWTFNVISENEEIRVLDMQPELIGQEGLVKDAQLSQGIPTYSLIGPQKSAWYHEDQLELISKNPNN